MGKLISLDDCIAFYKIDSDMGVNKNSFSYGDYQTGRKIYYISDLHVEFKDKKGFKNFTRIQYMNHVLSCMKSGKPYGDEPLLIAGDISAYSSDVEYFFSQLRMKREGIIVFVLGNHELWDLDETENRKLSYIIEKYREICNKYDIILLQNELLFVYDKRTENGELLPFWTKKIIREDELFSMGPNKLCEYAKRAKLVIYGGVGFSGYCNDIDDHGRVYNADMHLYRDIVPTLEEDIKESNRCENAYLKLVENLEFSKIIIFTHTPFRSWSTLEYNPSFIYVNGHTHHNYFENSKERVILADNQVGYSKDCYDLKYFYVDAAYDIFKNNKDGICKITYEQYIDFNIGKNIQMKKKNKGEEIYLLKKNGYYMFVSYSNKRLMLLNGGCQKKLRHDVEYYYKYMDIYGKILNSVMEKYTQALKTVSIFIKNIGGNGIIHGCIVDIDYFNHIYINPFDGRIVPYYAIDTKRKYVYKDLESLLDERCSRLLPNFHEWKMKKKKQSMPMVLNFEIEDAAILVTERSMYKASRIIKNIQYLLFNDVIRDWNDNLLQKCSIDMELFFDEINRMHIDV